MKRFQLQFRDCDTKALLRSSARESDTEIVFDEPGVYCQSDVPRVIYGRFPGSLDPLRYAVTSIEYHESTRNRGLKSRSRIFGYKPRAPLRQDFCSATSMAVQFGKQQEILREYGERIAATYRDWAPDLYAHHLRELEAVRPEWILRGTPFTSGIVNKDNPLKYHFDTGNFKNCFSCMLVLRQNVEGGYLSLPQYNARWLLEDGAYFLFDGQAILHGVTPMKLLNAKAYRYSVVYYALKAMANCGTSEEELRRIRELKRTREWKRI